MNCVFCHIELSPLPEGGGESVEYESGRDHNLVRCRDTLFRLRAESLQTLRAIRGVVALWEGKLQEGRETMEDVRGQLSLDEELAQTLLSVSAHAEEGLKTKDDQEWLSTLLSKLKVGLWKKF